MKRILIRNGFIVDGSGEPGYRGDLLVEGGHIKAMGPALNIPGADEIVDADKLAVTPGFIDIHSHSDGSVFVDPLSRNKLLQGVTSEVVGNCGFSPFPLSQDPQRLDQVLRLMSSLSFGLPAEGLSWRDFAGFADAADRGGLGVNFLPLIGHGPLRVTAMGSAQRAPTPDEMAEMAALLRRDLEQGAWGLSSGLAYAPGSFAESAEIEALCREVRQQDALYVSHIRNEGDDVLPSIDELIEVGRKTGCRVHISHLKAMGVKNWHQTDVILRKLKEARAAGVDVAADQYPYNASSTMLAMLVPKWANDGGVIKMLERLETPGVRERALEGIEEAMAARGGPERVLVAACRRSYDPPVCGRSIADIASQFGLSPAETVAKLLLDSENAVQAIYLSMADEDVEAIMADPDIMIGSDSMYDDRDPAHCHPRAYGTFPRVLGLYVRRKGILTLEAAVRKMTALSAARIGLRDRGLLKPGYVADITVFDPETVTDKGDYVKADRKPEGIVHVMVSGQWALRDGEITGVRAGRVLKKPRR